MRDLIRQSLSSLSGVEYAEARVHRVRSTHVVWSGRELEDIGESEGLGGCVRVLVKGAWGFCSFNNVREIGRYAAMARDQAAMVGGGDVRLAPVPPHTARVRAAPVEDPARVPLAEKEALCRRYNELLLNASPRIRTTSAAYSDAVGTALFMSTEGAEIEQDICACRLSLSAVAMDGADVQSGRWSVADQRGFQVCRGLDARCEEAAREAVDLLSARPVEAGRYTVICDPMLTGVFVHEAFGHLSEADFIYEHDRLKEMMTLGRRFAGERVSIVDDATLPGECGSYGFDSEGVPAQRTWLLREGRLAGRLHSRETAARMNETPTGNARAMGSGYPPVVRMSNTFLLPGDASFERMLAETRDGLYARGFLGGQTDMEMFSFSAERAWRIRGGKLAEPLRDVVLSGNVFHTLSRIDAIGNDLRLNGGGCGKGNQSSLPVSDGGPHVRVRGVVVGGK